MQRDPWRDSCIDFPDLMTRLSRFKLSARLSHLDLYPDAVRPLARDSCPDFPDLLSRLSRLKLSARLRTLGLNPDAAQYLARLLSRLSRLYVQTFQNETLGAIMQFGCKSEGGATLGATRVQTLHS